MAAKENNRVPYLLGVTNHEFGWILLSLARSLSDESAPCEPGFSEQRYAFTVTRKVLERGRILGKVRFESCSRVSHALYSPEDTRFRVLTDGTVVVKRQLVLHSGSVSFVLNAWDISGKKHSVPIFVWNERDQQDSSLMDHADLFFKANRGPARQKRQTGWVVPPIRISENGRGPFPKRLVQVKSKNKNAVYNLTGNGSDSPPVGVFTIDRKTGWLMVTKALDREDIPKYIIYAHALSEEGHILELPVEIIIHISDQNDNTPIFTKGIFAGSVLEGAPPGTAVMTVTATDADDAVDSNNGVVSYSIFEQTPKEPSNQMFTINADTGLISVKAVGLDRKFAREYTLSIKASDMEGVGLLAVAKAVITVNDPKKTMSGAVGNSLTTHVLNTAQGIPAKDLTLTLSKHNAASGKWVQLSRSVTNEDGRCPAIQRGETLTAGTYQLRFDTEDYWKKMQQESFYPYVEIVFTIKDVKDKYHIPLLLSPYSYTTYRGS